MPPPEAVQCTIRSRIIAIVIAATKLYKSERLVQLYPSISHWLEQCGCRWHEAAPVLQLVFLTELFPRHAQRCSMLFQVSFDRLDRHLFIGLRQLNGEQNRILIFGAQK